MLVECLEGADENSGILKNDTHPVVEVLVHLVAASDSHFGKLGKADLSSEIYYKYRQLFKPNKN